MSVGIFAVKIALGPVLLPQATDIPVRPELVEGPAAQ